MILGTLEHYLLEKLFDVQNLENRKRASEIASPTFPFFPVVESIGVLILHRFFQQVPFRQRFKFTMIAFLFQDIGHLLRKFHNGWSLNNIPIQMKTLDFDFQFGLIFFLDLREKEVNESSDQSIVR